MKIGNYNLKLHKRESLPRITAAIISILSVIVALLVFSFIFLQADVNPLIGYKELFTYLEGHISLEEAVSLIKRSTRRFAKRQFTWFRKMKNVIWIEAGRSVEEIVEEILSKVKNLK